MKENKINQHKFDKAKSHMARPKDRGDTDCNDNSIKITEGKCLKFY